MKRLVNAAIMMALLGVSVGLAQAQDPLKAAPSMYTLIFENDRVRVMQVVFKVGEKIPQHSHPDHFVYVLEGGKAKISKPDGTAIDADFKAGQVVWLPAETHWAQNTGTTPLRLLVTELKEKPKAPPAKP